MNTHALIPLIATIVYIPLFAILLANRPWQRKQKFLLLFLIPAVLWSASDLIGRSDWFMEDKLFLVKLVLCIGIWMAVQYHYFLRSSYHTQRIKIPLAYVLLMAAIVMAALGYIPHGVTITASGIHVEYGSWYMIIAVILVAIGGRDIYYLVRRRRILADPAERNQIVYLFLGVSALIIFALFSFTPFGGGYPFAHIGNLINAGILTYAVVRYRLLDARVVLRKVVMYTGLYIAGVAVLMLLIFLAHLTLGFNPDIATLTAVIGVGIPLTFILFNLVRVGWQNKIEQTFAGEKYYSRRQLFDFVTRIYDVPTLEHFGSKLISLLSQCVDSERTCLLLPQDGSTNFAARFVYPPVGDNALKGLRLRCDSLIVKWLKRNARILPVRNISILPEFQGLWREEKEDIQSAKLEMFVPLMHGDRLVAILAVGNKRDKKLYRVEEIDLLESIGERVAASMEKEYLYEQVKEQGEELAIINRLVMLVTSNLNIQDIFEGFAQELKKVIEVDWATIALVEEDKLRFLALSSTIGSAWEQDERIPLKGTATEWVVREKESVYEANMARHRRFWTGEHHFEQGVNSIVYLPLIVKDESIGSLIIACRRTDAYNQKQIRLLEHLALQIAVPIENSQLYARAEQRARIDELTGLFSRRHFEERLKEEIARHSRYGNVFSLLMIDLDSFKTYNDIYGHPSGDRLLSQIGEIVMRSVRGSDQAFRYGGDEFTVILPRTTTGEAYVVAERIRENIAAEMKAKEVAVTCSIGLASYPSDGVMGGELVTVVDTALYYAKQTGGDRTYLSSKILSELPNETGTYARGSGLSAVYALASAVDAKDHYTYGHSRKVNTYAVALAEAVGLSPDEVSRISTAALLHDIGKIGISDRILNKKGKLTDEEWEAIKSHPRLGANIVGNVPGLVPCVSGILYNHERWDGTGYPEGLEGETIPLDARIMAIADAFAAMTSVRPYRDAFCEDKVIEQLKQNAGKQFDPRLVEVFIGVVKASIPEKVEAHKEPSSEQANL